MNGETLEQEFRALGLAGTLEVRERLAVLRLADPAALADRGRRQQALALASAHGATHLAIELADDPGAAAALPRD